ncbi:MAG: type II toxin-antitoxin system YafQ family toxin [Clostridia bacterium]|nr:type II toxin-antitoxin system YafQ family toxin [Clostridia bacterium]
MREIHRTPKFVKDIIRYKKRGYALDYLEKVIDMLASDSPLPRNLRDHKLEGKYKGTRELHLDHDWLLRYEKDGDRLYLWLIEMDTHENMFGR